MAFLERFTHKHLALAITAALAMPTPQAVQAWETPAVVPPPPREVVIIDSRVAHPETLQAARSPAADVYVLDESRSAIAQITDILTRYHQLTGVHLISHGQAGQLLLGDETLSTVTAAHYGSDLTAWGQALAPGGDLLLYGCAVGQADLGQTFIHHVASVTGADVAASTDGTGNAALGGNWTLEAATGPMETTPLSVPTYAGVLGTYSNPMPISIPASGTVGNASPYPSTITVSGEGTITDVKVTLSGFTHTWPDDVDILLVSPTGTAVVILSDVGGSDDINNITLTLDDAATTSLPDSSQLVSGTFKPTNVDFPVGLAVGGSTENFPFPAPTPPYSALLSAFNGQPANGIWSLYVVDDASGDAGILNSGWSLTITSVIPAPAVIGAPDFNGDGRSDILLIDATRQLQMYFMNAVAVASQANVGVPLNATTRVEGIGDTNGDQRADMVLRDTTTNVLTLWRMNGAGIIGQSLLDGGMAQPAALRGVGDLNGDGRADLVFQNETTGQVSVWFMNGATILAKANIGVADATQVVQALGDTNGNQRHDLLLRQGNQLKLWLMNGAGIIGQANVGMVLDPSAEVIGLNDLNGDGRADIVIRQGDTVSAWLMNGTTIFSQTDLAVPATGLETYGLGDFNGDKRFDLLHRFTDATRALRVWLMNGTAVIRQTNTTVTPPTTTEVVAPR